jgi:hypothetical protein
MVFAFTVEPFMAAFKDDRSTLFLVHLYTEMSPSFVNRALTMLTAPKTFIALVFSMIRSVARPVVEGRLLLVYYGHHIEMPLENLKACCLAKLTIDRRVTRMLSIFV